MGKCLKKFENKSNFQNFLNNHRLFVNNDNDNIVSYIKNYENNNYKVKYADNSDLLHYIYSFSKNELGKFDGFCSKYYNLKVPSSINCYGLYSRESDPDKSNKYILTFLKQDYIKAGVPYVLEINEVNNDNEYILEIYNGEVDTSDLLINDEYFTSVYTTDRITIGQYYSFFNSTLVISMGSDLTKLRNCYWSKNVFIDSNLSKTKFINEKPYIDLGLPSGLLWSKGNLCKDSQGNYYIGEEIDYGTYVSWGNINSYNDDDGYSFNYANYSSTPGYNVAVDILSNDDTHDICLATLGTPWHIPTKEDFQELYDNTDSEWVADYNNTGVAGYKFMKKSNHSVYIFFPASGLYKNTSLNYFGTNGYYWSASFYSDTYTYNLYFDNSGVNLHDSSGRYQGFTIRPVQ